MKNLLAIFSIKDDSLILFIYIFFSFAVIAGSLFPYAIRLINSLGFHPNETITGLLVLTALFITTALICLANRKRYEKHHHPHKS